MVTGTVTRITPDEDMEYNSASVAGCGSPGVTALPSLESACPVPLYVGIDIGKRRHVAGFVSTALLARHRRFERCPTLDIAQERSGFAALLARIKSYGPLED